MKFKILREAPRMATFAQHLAEGMTVAEAVQAMGHKMQYGHRMLQQLRRRMGPQAI